MAAKSRRIKELDLESSLPDDTGYCRKCKRVRKDVNFYNTTDAFLDGNGLLSICKECINTMYDDALSRLNSIQLATAFVCKKLNIKYSEEAINSALSQSQNAINKGKNTPPYFGLYKFKLTTTLKSMSMPDRKNADLSYQDNPIINSIKTDKQERELSNSVDDEVIAFWGNGYSPEEYQWFEKTLADWKKTHKCDTKAEETLLQEIVFKQYEIKKARENETSTATLVKELQDLMKTASVDPAKSNIAGGKNQDTFSAFIKMIEENEPAEFYKDKTLFEDYDNIGDYFLKYVTRPLKNFITGSRDFNVDVESDLEEELENLNDVTDISEIIVEE